MEEEYNLTMVEVSEPLSTSSNILLFQWVVPVAACETPEKISSTAQLDVYQSRSRKLADLRDRGYALPSSMTMAQSAIRKELHRKMSAHSASAYMMGNEYISYVMTPNAIDIWDQTKAFNESITLSKAMGFSYDATAVRNEVTELTNVCDQYRMSLETGAVDPETALPEFLAKLEAAGIDKVMAEKQTQLDAWLAAAG